MLTVFSILESLTCQSPHVTHNEDVVGFAGSAAWVIDGATGVSDRPTLTPDSTDAAWLATNLNRRLETAFARPDADPTTVLMKVEAEIEADFRSFEGASSLSTGEQPTAGLALVALVGKTLSFITIGDCRVLFENVDGSTAEFCQSEIGPIESRIIERRRGLIETYPGEDPWPRLKPFIQSLRQHINTEEGYSVVHPTRRWVHRLKYKKLPSSTVRHALIVSDGLYRLVDGFGTFDAPGLLREAIRKGLRELLKRLRSLEAADQNCEQYPRVKISDDASGVLIRIAATSK